MQSIEISRVTPVVEQVWISKQDALIYFGYENHKPTFQKLLREFKDHKKCKHGYVLPTNGIPILKIKTFEEFLKWRELNKYKRNK